MSNAQTILKISNLIVDSVINSYPGEPFADGGYISADLMSGAMAVIDSMSRITGQKASAADVMTILTILTLRAKGERFETLEDLERFLV